MAELIVGGCHAIDAGTVLRPSLVTNRGQSLAAAIHDVDGASAGDGSHTFTLRADRQIVAAVAVEVAVAGQQGAVFEAFEAEGARGFHGEEGVRDLGISDWYFRFEISKW
jgi:hypothetical protein